MTVRVALVGFSLEANSLAEPTHLADGIDVRRAPGGIAEFWESRPCVDEITSRVGDVEFWEGPFWLFPPGGPLVRAEFESLLDETRGEFAKAGRFDGVVVFGHGAAITTDSADADGPYLRAIREAVGDDVPVVCILDFHANLTDAMSEAADVLVAYRTNPHVDVSDRAVEAATHLCALMDGERTVRAWCHLPMRVPQIAQLTRGDEPFALAVQRAVDFASDGVLNVSVLGGFSLADTIDATVSVVATSTVRCADTAKKVALDVAATLWDERRRCRTNTTSIEDAVRMVCDNSEKWILSDGSDNPGGGAPGNTVHVLAALVEARVDGVHSAVHIDPQLVQQAWNAGVGATIRAEFNKEASTEVSGAFAADAVVLSLNQGMFVPGTGVYEGAQLSVGRSCALQIGGAVVGVGSRKLQCADPDTMRHVGCDPDNARVIVVKSRGHFRAGFEGYVDDQHIVEVGAPGVSTNDLQSVVWIHAPTNVFPFDPDVEWNRNASGVVKVSRLRAERGGRGFSHG